MPSPIWSPDGRWLALEVWANGLQGSGIWLLAADGSSQTLVDADGHDPYWVNEFQLIYGVNEGPHLYDITSGEAFKMDMPVGSWVLGVTRPDDLQTTTDTVRVTDTPVPYVVAVQDVIIYSGPDESYEVVGDIFDGQTARVTGAGYNNNWWRVICPDDTIGNCWVTGDLEFVVPVETANPLTTPPDPRDVEMMTTTYNSPDGRWQATVSLSEPVLVLQSDQFYNLLTVSDGTTTWTPVAEWRGYGLGDLSVSVYRWSQDGRYLYYTNVGSADGCGLFFTGSDLYRLDVNDGTVQTILADGLTGNFALAPDETTVAYISFNGQEVRTILRDVASGNERSILVPQTNNAQAGNFLWSPDGSQLLLTVAHELCSANWTHSLVRVDAVAGTAVTLIENDPHQFTILEWADNSGATVRLTDKDGSTWLLDVNSGNLTAE